MSIVVWLRWLLLVCVFGAAWIPVPVSAGSAKYGATEYKHHHEFQGNGVSQTHSFWAFGPINWRLEWKCPEGGYAIHVNLDRHTTFGWSNAWHKIYHFGPPNPTGEGRVAQGTEHTHNMPPSEFVISFHANSNCRYKFWWEYTNFTP